MRLTLIALTLFFLSRRKVVHHMNIRYDADGNLVQRYSIRLRLAVEVPDKKLWISHLEVCEAREEIYACAHHSVHVFHATTGAHLRVLADVHEATVTCALWMPGCEVRWQPIQFARAC